MTVLADYGAPFAVSVEPQPREVVAQILSALAMAEDVRPLEIDYGSLFSTAATFSIARLEGLKLPVTTRHQAALEEPELQTGTETRVRSNLELRRRAST